MSVNQTRRRLTVPVSKILGAIAGAAIALVLLGILALSARPLARTDR